MTSLNMRFAKQQGLSLIELMIAMLLGLVLMTGVINIFLSSSQTYRLQDALFRVQETSRFALEIMKTDLRSSGFDDFLGTYGVLKNLNQRSVFGVEQGLPSTPEIAANSVNGRVSDVMLVDGSETPAGLAVYYVAPDAAANGQLALFRNNAAIAENVEGLNIQYGVDTDSDRFPNRFADATAITAAEWSSGGIVAVKLDLLLAAGEPGLVSDPPAALPAPFNGVNISDGRLYRMFSTTVALRNKVP